MINCGDLYEILVQMPEDAYRNLNDNGTLILSELSNQKQKKYKKHMKKQASL